MWRPIDMYNDVRGRVRGVSFPGRSNQFAVWTDAGLYTVWYFRSAFVSRVASAAEARAAFDPATGTLHWKNARYALHGDCGSADRVFGGPPRDDHPAGDRLVLDATADALHVTDAAGAVRQTIPHVRTASGPWAVAGFTDDYQVLLAADPSGVRLFRYAPERGAERPRWAAGGGGGGQRELFRAVCDHPDEDVPRLMYADWLDERGDAGRAEFIRVQCRLAGRERTDRVPHTDPDARRANDLLAVHGARWLAELPVIRGVHWQGFWRGFPGVRVASPTTLVRSAKKVWAAAPVQLLTVTDLSDTGAANLAGSAWLSRVRVLVLERYWAARDGVGPLRTLLHSPGAAGLRRFDGRYTARIGPDGVRALADSPHLGNLEWLSLSHETLTDDAAVALLRSPHLTSLRNPFLGSQAVSPRLKQELRARFPGAML